MLQWSEHVLYIVYLELTKRNESQVFLKGGQEDKKPKLESPACSSEPHEEKGDTDSWISEENDDEKVTSPPSKKD